MKSRLSLFVNKYIRVVFWRTFLNNPEILSIPRAPEIHLILPVPCQEVKPVVVCDGDVEFHGLKFHQLPS